MCHAYLLEMRSRQAKALDPPGTKMCLLTPKLQADDRESAFPLTPHFATLCFDKNPNL
jgi:hypothetical protein